MSESAIAITRRTAIACALTGLGLVGCGGRGGASPSASAAAYRVGVLQLVEHAALDAANKGFAAALDEAGIECTIDQQNAQGDQSACQTIAAKLVGDRCDLILAIGTPAAQAVAGATSDIPVVGTAITDFAASDLVESNERPGGNVTGASDLTPVADQIDLLHRILPDAGRVGLLYCTAEANSVIQIEMAERALDGLGIGHDRYTVSSSNEIQQVTEAAVGKVDAIYAPTDNTIAAGMATVAMVARENKTPTVVGCDTMVEDGGMVSYSISYEDLGRRAGSMAVRILKGEAVPADMPIETLGGDECKLVVNAEMARACGVDVSGLEADATV